MTINITGLSKDVRDFMTLMNMVKDSMYIKFRDIEDDKAVFNVEKWMDNDDEFDETWSEAYTLVGYLKRTGYQFIKQIGVEIIDNGIMAIIKIPLRLFDYECKK